MEKTPFEPRLRKVGPHPLSNRLGASNPFAWCHSFKETHFFAGAFTAAGETAGKFVLGSSGGSSVFGGGTGVGAGSGASTIGVTRGCVFGGVGQPVNTTSAMTGTLHFQWFGTPAFCVPRPSTQAKPLTAARTSNPLAEEHRARHSSPAVAPNENSYRHDRGQRSPLRPARAR